MKITLSTVGRVCTPIAMVVSIAYEMNQNSDVTDWWKWLFIPATFLTGAGIEVVGILSGKTVEGFWRIKDTVRAGLALTLLLIYTGVSVWILWNNQTLAPVPIIAAVVYVVSALSESLEVETKNLEKQQVIQTAFDLKQKSLDLEAERKRTAENQQRQHQERMAQLAAQRQAADRQAEQDLQLKLESKRLAHEEKMMKLQNPQSAPQNPQSAPQNLAGNGPYECVCGKVFAKPNSYSAHTRHCGTYKLFAANGHKETVNG